MSINLFDCYRRRDFKPTATVALVKKRMIIGQQHISLVATFSQSGFGDHVCWITRRLKFFRSLANPFLKSRSGFVNEVPDLSAEFCASGELHSLQYGMLFHPTLPSRLIPSSFCASTANSIGSCCSTSLAKPLTIRATASSCDNPRCIA